MDTDWSLDLHVRASSCTRHGYVVVSRQVSLIAALPTFIHTYCCLFFFFFFSSRRRHTRFDCDWSSDVWLFRSLPRDATAALAGAGEFPQEKVVVRFKAVGSAPLVKRDVCKVSSSQKFETVVSYLRRVLRARDTDSVFLYVNSSFAPALDEIVGNLHRASRPPPLPASTCRAFVSPD